MVYWKPTRDKVVFTLASLVVWYALLVFFKDTCNCMVFIDACFDLDPYVPVSIHCGCGCLTWKEALWTYTILITPAVAFYVIVSAFQKFKLRKR